MQQPTYMYRSAVDLQIGKLCIAVASYIAVAALIEFCTALVVFVLMSITKHALPTCAGQQTHVNPYILQTCMLVIPFRWSLY